MKKWDKSGSYAALLGIVLGVVLTLTVGSIMRDIRGHKIRANYSNWA